MPLASCPAGPEPPQKSAHDQARAATLGAAARRVPVTSPAGGLLALQRTAGNRTVRALLSQARRPRLMRVGLLDEAPDWPAGKTSAAYFELYRKLTRIRDAYAQLKQADDDTRTLALLERLETGFKDPMTEADAEALRAQLIDDIRLTREQITRETGAAARIATELATEWTALLEGIRARLTNPRELLLKHWRDLAPSGALASRATCELTSPKRDTTGRAIEGQRAKVADSIGSLDAKAAGWNDLTAARDAMLTAINAHRKTVRAGELARNEQLERAAQRHAVYLSQAGAALGHGGEGGNKWGDRVREAGYPAPTTATENVGGGPGVIPDAMVQKWLQSSGHRTSLESGEQKDIGIGFVRRPNGDLVWVTVFARPASA